MQDNKTKVKWTRVTWNNVPKTLSNNSISEALHSKYSKMDSKRGLRSGLKITEFGHNSAFLVVLFFSFFKELSKGFCQGILENFVEKTSDGIQYHRVRWYSIPSKFIFHKKCYILFSKHYFPILTHFVQKYFHGIEYRWTFITQKCKK